MVKMLDVSHSRTLSRGWSVTGPSDMTCIGVRIQARALARPQQGNGCRMQRQHPVGGRFQTAVRPVTGVVQVH